VLLSVALGLSKFRSSAICVSSRFFCSSKPAMAAATISVLSFVGMSVSMIESVSFAGLTIVLLKSASRRGRNAISAERYSRIGRLTRRLHHGLSTITTKITRHLSQPPTQQTRQPSMRSPSATGLNNRKNLVSTSMAPMNCPAGETVKVGVYQCVGEPALLGGDLKGLQGFGFIEDPKTAL
jgi:hypothetical protein